VTETTKKAAPNKALYIVIAVMLAVAVAAGVYYYRGGFDQGGSRVADNDKVDPDVLFSWQLGRSRTSSSAPPTRPTPSWNMPP
jgi:hypothetical protein